MAITIGKSFAVFPIDVPGAVEAFAVDGSPADTVMLGLIAPIWAFDGEEEEEEEEEEEGVGEEQEAARGEEDGVDGGDEKKEKKEKKEGGGGEAGKKDDGSGGYSRSLRRLASGGGSGGRRTLRHAASFSAAVEEALGELTLRDRDGSVVAVEGPAAAAAAAASPPSFSSYFYPHSRFDLVASGTNKGDNLGHHCWYSGTVGAAREGALSALPSIAFSLDDHGAKLIEDFDYCSEFAAGIVSAVLQLGAKHRRSLMGHVLNVNFPTKRKCLLRLEEEEQEGEKEGKEGTESKGGSSAPRDRMRVVALTTQGGHCWRPGFDERYARVEMEKNGDGKGAGEEAAASDDSVVISPRAAAVAGDKASEPTTRYFKNIGGRMWEDRETAGTDSWAVNKGMASVVVLGLKQHALTRGEKAHVRELEEGERATEAGKEVVEVAARGLGVRAVLLPG